MDKTFDDYLLEVSVFTLKDGDYYSSSEIMPIRDAFEFILDHKHLFEEKSHIQLSFPEEPEEEISPDYLLLH